MQESSEFRKRSFEYAVDSIRAIAASHLWQVVHATLMFLLSSKASFLRLIPILLQLVVVRADLNGHLKALKDYFLLAKGDFFQVKGGGEVIFDFFKTLDTSCFMFHVSLSKALLS